MKVLTILGTRPEIIRLSRIIPLLDKACEHVLVHTGQNYINTLSEIFLDELNVRTPDFTLTCKSNTPMQQIGMILTECEKVLADAKPDRLLLLGDTNSALSVITAKRMRIPVYHMEAGNRCFDDRVPEEVNRRIIDHTSDILLPYTERSRANLLREGISSDKIFVTGNPIKEVLDHFAPRIENSKILETLSITAGSYFLITLHRAENVDEAKRLKSYLKAFHLLWIEYQVPIICSFHPRTIDQIQHNDITPDHDGLILIESLGLFDFVHLEQRALCVLTDSGTVQEECCIFKVPNVTLRDVTERPETLEVGSNILSGADPASILSCVKTVLSQRCNWNPPQEYLAENVSNKIVKIVLGHQEPAR